MAEMRHVLCASCMPSYQLLTYSWGYLEGITWQSCYLDLCLPTLNGRGLSVLTLEISQQNVISIVS